MVLVAKPAGPTSHDVVDIVRRILGTSRVGHLGTLDPFATGLLVLVIGRATRLAPFTSAWTKSYVGVIRLGTRTATDDGTGAVVAVSDTWRTLDRDRIASALEQFRGPYEQQPPAYSAVRVEGERAYRRARRGERVAPAARRVEVRELSLEHVSLPDVGFRATVTAGTYLRSLARDVGDALGCGAHLATLTRTEIGPFRLEHAVAPAAVTASAIRDPAVLVANLPRRELAGEERQGALHGRTVPAGEGMRDAEWVALFAGGSLVAVAENADGVLKPRVVVVDE